MTAGADAGERIPVPDPSERTRDDLYREISLLQAEVDRRLEATQKLRDSQVASEHAYVDAQVGKIEERLGGMDKATALLSETVTRVPTDVQKEVSHLRELTEEQFRSIATQFSERDTRSERESRDNKVAVDAAFAAQKEAAAKQDESNLKAIDKSEKATAETIKTLSELFQTNNKALADKIDDLKERQNGSEARSSRSEGRVVGTDKSMATIIAIAAVVVTILIGVGSLAVAFSHKTSTPTQVIVPPNTPTTLVR